MNVNKISLKPINCGALIINFVKSKDVLFLILPYFAKTKSGLLTEQAQSFSLDFLSPCQRSSKRSLGNIYTMRLDANYPICDRCQA